MDVNKSDVKEYPSVSERYYVQKYRIDLKSQTCNDQCVLFHSNRICVICVATSHPLVNENKTIEKIDFQVSQKVNRLENKVSGKGKKGGQWLIEDSPLCNVSCSDGSQYTIYSCVRGKLIEVNERLLTMPQLIAQKPQSDGYIAIVLPKLGESEHQQKLLLNADEYKEALSKRQLSASTISQ